MFVLFILRLSIFKNLPRLYGDNAMSSVIRFGRCARSLLLPFPSVGKWFGGGLRLLVDWMAQYKQEEGFIYLSLSICLGSKYSVSALCWRGVG